MYRNEKISMIRGILEGRTSHEDIRETFRKELDQITGRLIKSLWEYLEADKDLWKIVRTYPAEIKELLNTDFCNWSREMAEKPPTDSGKIPDETLRAEFSQFLDEFKERILVKYTNL